MASTSDVGHTLCRMMREGRDVERCAAAQALGEIGYKDAAAALIEGLRDEDEDVRVDSAEALGAVAHPGAGAALLDSLVEDPVGEVKVAAVAALGHLKDAAAIPVLRELVCGREGHVAWDEEEFLSGGWDDWLDVQVKAIEALGEMGAVEAVPDIVASVEDEMGQDLGPVAFRALAKLGQAGLGAVAAVLRSGAERQRRRAAEALRECGSQAACEILAIALGDRSADIRGIVLSALAARNPEDPRLGALLADPDPGVRSIAVRLAGHHWPEQLDGLLDDPSEQVQAEVVALLSANTTLPKPKDFAFRLRVKMRGPSEQVAIAACQAIAELAPERALADLRKQLHDTNCPAEVRRAAARALAKLGSAEAVEALSAAVDDDHREVRTETIAALAQVARNGAASESASSVLVRALRGELVPPPEGFAPPENATTSNKVAPSQAAPKELDGNGVTENAGDLWPTSTLQAITGDDADATAPPSVPQSVELNEKDLELLALTATGPRKKHVPLNPPVVLHEDVRRLAALVLGDVAVAEVAEALAAVLDDEDLDLRRRAADSLARVGSALRGGLPPAVCDALLGSLEDQDRDLRLATTRALGRTSTDAVTALTGRLRDSDSFVRVEAVRALDALGTAPVELFGLLSDEYPGVRLAAAEAIARHSRGQALAPLVELAFAYSGIHAADVARLLRDLDRETVCGELLATLRDPGQQSRWRIAIDVLKEINRPRNEPAPRMVA